MSVSENHHSGRQLHQNTLSFHGKRQQLPSRFYIYELSASRMKSGNFAITVIFNSPLDANSVTEETIQINGTSLPGDALIRYNKAGNALRIILPQKENQTQVKCSLEFIDFASFNGNPLENCFFDSVTEGCCFQFEE